MNIAEKARGIKTALADRGRERKRLRGPANLGYAIADSITMLDGATWQALTAQAGFFMSHAYLKALEDVLPDNLAPRYALIYDNGGAERKPVAAVYMQIAEISLAQFGPEKSLDERNDRNERKRWPAPLESLARNATQRVLTCGNLLSYGQHGIAFAPDADEKAAWHGIAEVLYRVRQAEKLAGKTHFVMIKDLHAPFTDQAAHLRHLSYRYVETEPNMVLTLEEGWTCYEHYLASLSSKYRGNVRNGIFKPMEEAGCTVEHLADLAPLQDQLFALYKAVQSNAGFRPFQLRPEYFAALQGMAGARFRCSVVKRGPALLGFMMSVADGDTAIAYHIGFDRAAAAELPIYLRLLHAGIADAIALGCKRVSYGRTALEPKAALGAKPQAFGVLLRHRQPVLNKLIKHLLMGIEHDDAPERNPFKSVKKDNSIV